MDYIKTVLQDVNTDIIGSNEVTIQYIKQRLENSHLETVVERNISMNPEQPSEHTPSPDDVIMITLEFFPQETHNNSAVGFYRRRNREYIFYHSGLSNEISHKKSTNGTSL